jgi:hypothetical protein
MAMSENRKLLFIFVLEAITIVGGGAAVRRNHGSPLARDLTGGRAHNAAGGQSWDGLVTSLIFFDE